MWISLTGFFLVVIYFMEHWYLLCGFKFYNCVYFIWFYCCDRLLFPALGSYIGGNAGYKSRYIICKDAHNHIAF